MGRHVMRTPTLSIEVITLPVSDVDRALRFYVDRAGFVLGVRPRIKKGQSMAFDSK